LKNNGKYVVPISQNRTYTAVFTIPHNIVQKYKLTKSDVEIEERSGGLFIKKSSGQTRTKTFLTGKTSCGLTIPAYLAHKYEYSGDDGCYVVLTEESDGIFMKKLIL
jgi:hypothetical protein